MDRRYLTPEIESLAFGSFKMAFLSGPRQVGKTTLSKLLLGERELGAYYSWDDVVFRRQWVKDPKELVPAGKPNCKPLVILDEIHKAKLWKRSLKGVFDVMGEKVDLLVTGSARLGVYRRGSDSLLGRYFHFRLHPFSIAELSRARPREPEEALNEIISRSRVSSERNQSVLNALLRYGGFPEPFLAASDKRARLWRRGRVEKVIREDLRDLSRLPDLSRIEMLASLLPERVGSLVSVASLREDLEVSHDSVKRWLGALSELYYLYEVKPYHPGIRRSLRKEGKIYLWDHSEVEAPGPRFENLVAGHLLKACDYWTDTGEGDFSLRYLRDKEKRELDFLIVRDKKPWLPVEVKLSDLEPSPAWKHFLPQLPCNVGLQLVATPGHWKWHTVGNKRVLVASAAALLEYLI
ncbi:MAG: ATP-binding protein [Polyangiaceae bacterium]|nr:ATP-binding protein [Polyangiaceae bacterium]